MPKKSKKKTSVQYKDFYKSSKNASLDELMKAIQEELDREQPRADLLRRMVSRLNATRSRQTTSAVLSLLNVEHGKRSVKAALSRNG